MIYKIIRTILVVNIKKLNFDIWIDKKNNLILKVKYKRMGEWEYRLKDFK